METQCYIQHQNSSLNTEFSEIIGDVQELKWATDAFGYQPDASNVWIGKNATSSVHRDPYENIYCVVRYKLLEVTRTVSHDLCALLKDLLTIGEQRHLHYIHQLIHLFYTLKCTRLDNLIPTLI